MLHLSCAALLVASSGSESEVAIIVVAIVHSKMAMWVKVLCMH